MRQKLATLLAAFLVVAAGLYGAPAQAGPSVSLAFNGFFAASNAVPLTFELVDAFADLGLSQDVIDAMDGAEAGEGGYAAILGLHYEIMVDDPSPATPRDWLLSFDLGIDGLLAVGGPPLLFDETDLPFPSSLSGIPIADLIGGPFSVDDLAVLGGLIFDEILAPCAGPPAVSDSGVGACLYVEGPGGPLSGDLFVGLTPRFTENLLDELLGLDIGDLPDLFVLAAFEGDAILTTAVPEPGTFAMIGLGLVVVGFARRRYAG